MFGGKQVTEPAGNWPWALCETLLRAATQELVLRSTRIADELKRFEAKPPDQTLQLTGNSHEIICGELYLRRSVTDVYVMAAGAAAPSAQDGMRQIRIVRGATEEIVDYAEGWSKLSQFEAMDTDLTVIIQVRETPDPEAFPAIRRRLTFKRPDPYASSVPPWQREPAEGQPPWQRVPAGGEPPDAAAPEPEGNVMPDDEFRRERPAVVAGHGRAAEAPEQDAPATTVPELDFPERVATAAQPQVQDLVLDTIGPKPEGVQRSVWTAMERLHRVLGHPTTT